MPPRLLDKALMISILHTYLKSYTAQISLHIYTHTCTHLKGSYDTRINNIPPQEPQINKNPVPGMKNLL